MECHQCLVTLSESAMDHHIRRFHLSEPRWVCGDCDFASASFPHALAHSLLEGHSLNLLQFTAPERKHFQRSKATNSTTRRANETNPGKPQDIGKEIGREAKVVDRSKDAESFSTVEDASSEEVPVLVTNVATAVPESADISCLQCGKYLKDAQNNRLYHVLSSHQIRPYACPACRKAFTQRSPVLRHQRTSASCQGAGIVIQDREANEAAIRNGFEVCFGVHFEIGRRFIAA